MDQVFDSRPAQYVELLNAVADENDPNGLYNSAMGAPDHRFQAYRPHIDRIEVNGKYQYSVPADWANRPVVWVSFWDAIRFTNWLSNGQPHGPQGPSTTEDGAYHDLGSSQLFGRRAEAKFFIPTEDEWYKAAYHDSSSGKAATYFSFPTSTNEWPSSDPTEAGNPGNNSNFDYAIGSPYFRSVVGEYELSTSPYGTFDQGGNVWEWNETSVANERVVRGGAFDHGNTFEWASYRLNAPTDDEWWTIGFRVAGIVENAIPGDANRDGRVDLSDFGVLKANFGTGTTWSQGDFNSDSKVDLSDFGVLKVAFGTSAVARIPEPCGFVLAIAGLAAMVSTWARRFFDGGKCLRIDRLHLRCRELRGWRAG